MNRQMSADEKFEATARRYAALTGKDLNEARREIGLARQSFADDWEAHTRSRSYRREVRRAKFESSLTRLGERIRHLAHRAFSRNLH